MGKEILNPKVQASGVIDVVGMLAAKRIVDSVSVPFVGNNNIVAAGAKLLIGGMAYGKGGRIGNVITGGLILDGADDAAGVLMARFGGVPGGMEMAVNPGL